MLRGDTGEGIYAKSIKVSDVKPQDSNSALRYLWARHRIAVLADYNRLRANDERIKEVTSLGLTYNLLTAYTSFVAIDSEKRLKNGDETVTIKQPLPLPQGVSNYAVGSSMQRFKAAAPVQSFGYAGGQANQMILEEKDACKKEYMAPQEPASSPNDEEGESPADAKGDKAEITIKKISVTKDLSESRVRRIIEANLADINKCFFSKSVGSASLFKNYMIKLIVAASGNVKTVTIDGKIETALKDCLVKAFKGFIFPALSHASEAEIIVILTSK